MKKAIIFIIVSILIFSLIGCTPKKDESSFTVESGVLKVGMDLVYPPFETFDESGEPAGISVDVAKGLADYLGLELEIVNMDFSTIIPALETKDIDISIASMGYTKERDEKVDFSDPYFYFKMIGFMNKEYADTAGLTSESKADELWKIKDTKFIGVAGQTSSTIPADNGFEVELSADVGAAIMQIVQGKADFLVYGTDMVVPAYEKYKDDTVLFWTPLDVSPICMSMSEGNTELQTKANAYIATLKDDDGIYQQLGKKYNDTIESVYGAGVTMDFYINE